MKAEYDFGKGERGKFYRPKDPLKESTKIWIWAIIDFLLLAILLYICSLD